MLASGRWCVDGHDGCEEFRLRHRGVARWKVGCKRVDKWLGDSVECGEL